MKEIRELGQAATALWVVPWGPVAGAAVGAWAADWAVPALVLLAFIAGWAPVWYLWLFWSGQGGDGAQSR